MLRRVVFALAVLWLAPASKAAAQTAPAPDPTQASQPPAAATTSDATTDTRPATTTWFGDTGLWFVPTGEVLPHRKWSASGYRANFDREQGFTDISHFIGTFGIGIGDRAEVFGSFRFDTRIDRDIRPLFTGDPDAGGVVNEFPLVRTGWTGDNVGDLLVGAKINILSEHRQQPLAFAVRGTVKLPTGDEGEGVGTGQADFYVDAIASKEINQRVEVAGFGGLVFRGDPDEFDLTNGFRWGIGAGFPTRTPLRVFTELHGELRFDETVTGGPISALDLSVSPLFSNVNNTADATLGLIWQGSNGFFAGAGLNVAFPLAGRSEFGSFDDRSGDRLGFQARIGYHPGVRVYVPPPPPPPPPPPAPANRPPTVKARCEPCTVEVGKSSTLTADAQDPDGDSLTYRWSAPTGTFANPAERQTLWTAPDQEGAVPATVAVDDGKGGTASDTVTLQVIRPAPKTFVFEDVHFDFDRYTLRPEAARVLDEVVTTLRENSGLRVEIEGHTCNIGTAEYNLALGDRRAHAVRDYLASRGIGAERFRTVSYGEERPKHDNSREETRRLNRRAALVVRVQ